MPTAEEMSQLVPQAFSGPENNNNGVPFSLPMRTMSMSPGYSSSNRPADIPAYLESQGVPLNTPIRPGDTGRGPMPMTSIHMPGATAEQYEQAYRQQRASMLYQLLSDRGYFALPPESRRPLRNVLGLNGAQTPSIPSLSSTRVPGQPFAGWYSAMPASIPVREGTELRMRRNALGSNAVDLEDFIDGETVEVLYTPDQVRRMDQGETVRVTPSMVLKRTSVEQLVTSGSRTNPTTRQPIALRERRVLRLTNSNNQSSQGGKRKNRKSTRKNRKH